jgi:hypothetical protein
MVPIHLGLKIGPFVPLNLISIQGSPVPMLKFHMAPRLKLLKSSGSKKKEPRYTRSATPATVPSYGLDPSVNQTGVVPGPLAHSLLVNIVTLYLVQD